MLPKLGVKVEENWDEAWNKVWDVCARGPVDGLACVLRHLERSPGATRARAWHVDGRASFARFARFAIRLLKRSGINFRDARLESTRRWNPAAAKLTLFGRALAATRLATHLATRLPPRHRARSLAC